MKRVTSLIIYIYMLFMICHTYSTIILEHITKMIYIYKHAYKLYRVSDDDLTNAITFIQFIFFYIFYLINSTTLQKKRNKTYFLEP